MSEKTYEMLWDCGFCGAEKLLGKTHRHCPSCGGPQDPEARYFPDVDADRVAVEDHQYVGADWSCGACDSPNSAVGEFCTNCGGAKDGGHEVGRVEDVPVEEPLEETVPAGSSGDASPPWKLIAVAAVVVVAGLVSVFFFWTVERGLQVSKHSWERSVGIEEYRTVQDRAWQDQVPPRAFNQVCERKQRTTKQVPDGETCKNVREDKGDGTFIEKEECSTNYRQEPVYDQECKYSVDTWVLDVTLSSSGMDLKPSWPESQIEDCALPRQGCKREGTKQATYTVHYEEEAGVAHTCKFDIEKWSSFEMGSEWTAEFRKVGGGIVCDSLAAL